MNKNVIYAIIVVVLIIGVAYVTLAEEHSKTDKFPNDCWAKQDVRIRDIYGTAYLVASGTPVKLTHTPTFLFEGIDVYYFEYFFYIENTNPSQDVFFRADGLTVEVESYRGSEYTYEKTDSYEVTVDDIQITPVNTDITIIEVKWREADFRDWKISMGGAGKLVFSVVGNIEMSSNNVNFTSYTIPDGVELLYDVGL